MTQHDLEWNTHDLEAVCDLLTRGIVEDSDRLTFEETIATLQALTQVKQAVAEAISFVETQQRKLLDSPRQVGDTLYKLLPTKKRRPDHDAVRRAVIERSLVDGNGEILEPRRAVERAWKLMTALYVSPSQMPKTGGLAKVGLDKEDAGDSEHVGDHVAVFVVGGEE